MSSQIDPTLDDFAHDIFKSREVTLDKHHKRFKKFYLVLGFIPLSDGWQPILGNPTKVVLVKTKMKQKMNSSRTMGNSSTVSLYKYVLYVTTDQKGKQIEIHKYDKAQNAYSLAERIAKYFGVPFEDRSSKDS